ncbi:MAG: hypothetical protein JWS12_400, partial [Candidatus Saccharibacteria bacterium]|nr:hypothetical protein [Candidatus Saccharibacteria bacterium]
MIELNKATTILAAHIWGFLRLNPYITQR